jgi:prolipoprotein diacylglyceryltransferase
MFQVFQVGPLELQAPGLILLVGVWLGLILAERLAPRFGAQSNQVYNLVFVALIAGVIGARVSFVIQNIEVFFQSPLNVFSLTPGLLDPLGGLAFGLVIALVYGNRKKIPWGHVLDAIVPFLCVMMIAFGASNFASGDFFGMETALPWGIELWGAKRHPTQMYLIIAGLVILSIIWFRSTKPNLLEGIPGITFIRFVALSAGAFLFIEGFRADNSILENGIRVNQIIAWLVLAASLLGLQRLRKMRRLKNLEPL